MEYELELQDFPKAKKVSRAILEFEDYAHEWWKNIHVSALSSVAAIKGNYVRSVHNLLVYALKEERKIKSNNKIIFQSALICAKTLLQGYMS
jgi:hypothetical protein